MATSSDLLTALISIYGEAADRQLDRYEEALAAFHLPGDTVGILPALESAHAWAWVVREAEALRDQAVLLNLSGRGDKDLAIVLEAGRQKKGAP